MNEMWTILKGVQWTTEFLSRAGSASPRLDAECLLAHALGVRRLELYLRFDQPLVDEERSRFRELIVRRANGEPVAYLTGRKEFYSVTLEVGRGVLVPRSETETLVAEAIEHLRRRRPDLPRDALDLCTGSGAIACALARELADLRVDATELDAEALAFATRNVEQLGLGDRVCVLQGDLDAPLDGGQRYSVIVSNPPYVRADSPDAVESGVLQHEPAIALFGGADGLGVLRRIAALAPARLHEGGIVLLECGSPDQGHAVAEMLEAAGLEDARTGPIDGGPTSLVRAVRGASR